MNTRQCGWRLGLASLVLAITACGGSGVAEAASLFQSRHRLLNLLASAP